MMLSSSFRIFRDGLNPDFTSKYTRIVWIADMASFLAAWAFMAYVVSIFF